MQQIKTVLKKFAAHILSKTPDFDISECATLQYGSTPSWESFFKEMSESRGWDKVRKKNDIRTIEKAHFIMIDLLNTEIECLYSKCNVE